MEMKYICIPFRDEYAQLIQGVSSVNIGELNLHDLGAQLVEVVEGRTPFTTFTDQYLSRYIQHPGDRAYVIDCCRYAIDIIAQLITAAAVLQPTTAPIFFDHWTILGDLMVVVTP